MNEKGETDDMDWYTMGKEEVQDQLNDADVLDIFPVDILWCYWKPDDGKLMLRITGFPGLGEYTMKDEDMMVDYPYNRTLFLLNPIIGLEKYRENRNFRAAQ